MIRNGRRLSDVASIVGKTLDLEAYTPPTRVQKPAIALIQGGDLG